MAAWLVAVSPTSLLSVLDTERKGVTLLCACVFTSEGERERKKEREREREREREGERDRVHLSCLTLLSFPQSKMKLRFPVFCCTTRISKTHNARIRKLTVVQKWAQAKQKSGYYRELKWGKHWFSDYIIKTQTCLYPLMGKPEQAQNSHRIELCDVTSRHVFEPIAIAASIKRHNNCALNINQTIL